MGIVGVVMYMYFCRFACGLLLFVLAIARADAAPDVAEATEVFAEAKAICARDGERLWGKSLCGAIMLVDYTDRKVIANQADAEGKLVRDGNVFRGTLPAEVVIANTPTDWAGTRWTQLLTPVSLEPMNRHVTLAHELFHRIQGRLGLSRPESGNRHLDTLEGRYLLQLEWRALARALAATTDAPRREAVNDVLVFRRERDRLFPGAAMEEGNLEINEGVPEYTGVVLGLATPYERTAYAIYDLSRFVEAPSFVRSFAYATGPAYGLLLDELDPTWNRKLGAGRRLDELLATAAGIRTIDPAIHIANLKLRYDRDGSLRASEERRDRDRLARLADYRARLVDGSVLILPALNANYVFNPQSLVPLDSTGTIYPLLKLDDDWGTLMVESGGALVRKGNGGARVTAHGISASHLQGAGWTLSLKPSWSVAPGTRPGDFMVVRRSAPTTVTKQEGIPQ